MAAKKKAQNKPARTADRKNVKATANGRPAARLLPSAGTAAVRMYRHGLGDCFLLALATENRLRPCYALIDCGVHMRQTEGSERLAQVMDNIERATGGRIDVIVATHEHADHLSGFVQRGNPFLNKRIEFDRVWVGWTEKVGDAQADRLRQARGATREAIRQALQRMRERGVTALHDRVATLRDFDVFPDMALDERFLDSRASTNEVALELLKTAGGSCEYCEPGQVLSLPGTNARAYVLGPPRDETLLKRDRPRSGDKQETYLTSSGAFQSFFASPGLRMETGAAGGGSVLHCPFDERLRRECRFDNKPDANPFPTAGRTEEEKATQTFMHDRYFARGREWQRIDTQWLTIAQDLALALDSDTNNTSLVLAFELGEPGSGDVLLFVGDAQVGNWLSWRKVRFTAGGRSFSADDLLARTVLYKVGHHASHNGTVKRDPEDASDAHPAGAPFGLELMSSQLIALAPVDREAVEKPHPNPWHMPQTKLYRRLLEKASGRVLRSDGLEPEPEVGLESCGPQGSDWEQPLGLGNVLWREAKERFKAGRKCPLYYDLEIAPRDSRRE